MESDTAVPTKIWNRQEHEVRAKVYFVMVGAVKSAEKTHFFITLIPESSTFENLVSHLL